MAKRNRAGHKPRKVSKTTHATIEPPKVLAKQSKAALVEMLAELAEESRQTARRLMDRFDITLPAQPLVAATRQAIADATYYDPRQINYNFDWDYAAYDTVRRNLKQLVEADCVEEAMDLALELMARGSEQVEMSDEGMMTDDIEACLRELIAALPCSKLPAETLAAWVRKMLQADRVQFLCREELTALAAAP